MNTERKTNQHYDKAKEIITVAYKHANGKLIWANSFLEYILAGPIEKHKYDCHYKLYGDIVAMFEMETLSGNGKIDPENLIGSIISLREWHLL